MIDSGVVFTQISTINLDLHTKRLGSARNPPKRLAAQVKIPCWSAWKLPIAIPS
ncbi:hypothetical protein LINGRAHAP2_LOCUS8275 [Linum grandiflorum]